MRKAGRKKGEDDDEEEEEKTSQKETRNLFVSRVCEWALDSVGNPGSYLFPENGPPSSYEFRTQRKFGSVLYKFQSEAAGRKKRPIYFRGSRQLANAKDSRRRSCAIRVPAFLLPFYYLSVTEGGRKPRK